MESKFNVIIVAYMRPHLGGSGTMALELAKKLAINGHNVDIVSYPNTYLTEEEKNLGINHYPVEEIGYECFKAEPFHATLASQISNICLEKRIDIIHTHYAITHGEAALLAKEIVESSGKSPKVIITCHGSDIHTNGYHDQLSPVIKNTLEKADGITFVSKALLNEAKKLFQINSGKVVYNFIDEKRFYPVKEEEKREIRRKLNIPEDYFVVYHASNFRKVKNIRTLIESAKKISEEREKILFLLLGEGGEKEVLEELVKEEGIDNVRFVGKRHDVVPYIQSSDIAILPSLRESFGLILLEAMACGLPVLGSNVGGIPELIEDGKNGYLFNPLDINQIVNQILTLSKNKELRIGMGKLSRKIVDEKFNSDKWYKEYEKLYKEVLAY